MRNFIFIFFTLIFVLTGCSKAGSDVILTDSSSYSDSSSIIDSSVEDSGSYPVANISVSECSIETIVVYVCGAVQEPGVYDLDSDCRIADAVEAAGGFSEEADTVYVNLAARLQDGMKLQIPTIQETSEKTETTAINSYDVNAEAAESGSGSGKGLVNINTADKEQLKTLPGIGDGIAGRIVEFRNQNGKFKSIEDIKKVTGIKDKLFSKIKDNITV